MALKNALNSFQCISAQSMTGTVTSAITNIQFHDNVSYHIDWTGTAVGAFSVQTSIDGVNWDTLPLSPTPAAAGVAGSGTIECSQMAQTFIQLIYTPTSGTGTLNAVISAKSNG